MDFIFNIELVLDAHVCCKTARIFDISFFASAHNSFFPIAPCSFPLTRKMRICHIICTCVFSHDVSILRDVRGARFARFVSEFNSSSIQVNEDFRVMQRETNHNSRDGGQRDLSEIQRGICVPSLFASRITKIVIETVFFRYKSSTRVRGSQMVTVVLERKKASYWLSQTEAKCLRYLYAQNKLKI